MALAGGQLFLTVVYSAIAVWLLGLAVPVTASYIIAAVMVAPALVQSGVPDFAAHMFIFYYAVLSEVSPPTALSPFAAAALTGGKSLRDDDADVEVHAAGVPRPVRVHAEPGRRRRAASRIRWSTIVVTSSDRGRRRRRARRRPRRVGARPGLAARARRLVDRAACSCSTPRRGRTALGLAITAVVLFLHFWRAAGQGATAPAAATRTEPSDLETGRNAGRVTNPAS